MPGEASEKLCIVPSAEDVCLICQESSGVRVDKCADYKCQCRGIYFHEPCYEQFKGSPCPICRVNHQPAININIMIREDIQGRIRQMNEEEKQVRETRVSACLVSPFLVAAYLTTIVYSILACSEWSTYTTFQKATIIGLITVNAYMICRLVYCIIKPERWLAHSRSKLNTAIEVILLCFAVMSMFVYFQDPDVYNLKVASGITSIYTICSIGLLFVFLCYMGLVAACEHFI